MQQHRIAIYARYSTDLQNPTSVDDQVSLAHDLIERKFPASEIVATFSDSEITGTVKRKRNGYVALIAAMREKRFNLLVSEGLDRLSRRASETTIMYEIAEHYGVAIWTVHEGFVSEMHVALRGTMNALQIKDISQKVKRGLRAKAIAGLAPAGRAYGYKVVRGTLDERGREVKGVRDIDEDQAVIVRRIFDEYARGVATRAIIRSLNEDGIPGPTGGTWAPHTLHGGTKRGGGILKNNLYRGWQLFNRMRKVVDPETERQRYELNPEDEWIWTAVPNLRIVDDATWDTVQERLGGGRPVPNVNRRTKVSMRRKYIDGPARIHVLTGLVSCGWCGGKKSLSKDSRYMCDVYRYYDRRCTNARSTKEVLLSRVVFARLNEFVLQVRYWPRRLEKYFRDENARKEELLGTVSKIQHRIDRLMDAVEFGVQRDNTLQKIKDLEQRINDITSSESPIAIPADNREAQVRLTAALQHMEAHFDDRKEIPAIRMMLDLVVDDIKLTPRDDSRTGETVDITLKPAGWPEFYRQIDRYWPNLLGKKKSRRPAKVGR